MSTARFAPSLVSELAADQTDATISVGAGGASGDLILKVNGSESARFIFGSAGPPDTRGTFLFNHGDVATANYNVTTGRWIDVRHGYNASPDTTFAPSMRMVRIWSHAATRADGVNALNSATINVKDTTGFASSGTAYLSAVAFTYTGKTATSFTGCGNHAATVGNESIADFALVGDGAGQLATLSLHNKAITNSGAQAVGLYAFAQNDANLLSPWTNPSPDACAVYGRSLIETGGVGVSMAGCFVAGKNASAALVTALQLFSYNSGGSDSSYSSSSPSDCGIWMSAAGTGRSGAGILLTGTGGKQFDVGIGFMADASGTGGIRSAAIRDDSQATTSIVINGTHTNGIDLSGGTFSNHAILLPNNRGVIGKDTGGTGRNIGRVDVSDRVQIGDPSAAGGLLLVGSTITASAALAMGSHKITGLTPGTAANEAVAWPWPLLPGVKNVQAFGPGSNQTWTKPGTGTIAMVLIKGAGAGGGGGVATASAGNARYGGAGGGCGGWIFFSVPLAALGSTCNVNVATGGAGGSAGNAGSNASGTTAFDSAGGNANVTAATGGAAGGSGSPAAGNGGTATAPTYSGYGITVTATSGGNGAGSSITVTASSSTNGGGGGGGGVTTGPAGLAGGAGSALAGGSAVAGVGGANTGEAGSPTSGAVLFPGGPGNLNGGGGGGGKNGSGGGAGADGWQGGGGGGGGSCTSGTAGSGGKGGDGLVIVFVY